jgi:flagellar motor switch protein FliN/FliY
MNVVDVQDAPFVPTPGTELDSAANFRLLADVPIRLSVQVGSTSMKLSDLVELVEGSVVELDRQTHELLDITANGTLIARGEVVMVNGRFGVRVIDVVNTDAAAGSLERRA